MNPVTPTQSIPEEQIESFHRDGYCVVDALFEDHELAAIEAFFEDYKLNGQKVYDAGLTFEELDPSKQQVRAMHPHRYSATAREWFLNPKVMDVLESLLGGPALGVQTMYYYKPPGAKGQGMHQDNFYLISQPTTCIAAWTAIDASTDENGCLWVVPGSHKGDILCPKKDAQAIESWNNYGDSHIKPFPRKVKPVPVPVPRGSTMFFGGNLIHGSGPNRSKDRSRRTFIGHYINEASDCVAKHYHPVLNRHAEIVSNINVYAGGGPCGDGWMGATH